MSDQQLQKTNATTALANVRQSLTLRMDTIAAAVPTTFAHVLTRDRIMKIALNTVGQNALLMKCTPQSITRSIINLVSLGIEPGGPLGQGYLVPFFNRDINAYEAQHVIGYRGLVALARRSGEITSVHAHCVYENDTFAIEYGTSPKIEHKPKVDGPRGEIIGAYCVAHFAKGGYLADHMTLEEIHAIRMRSPTGKKNEGPWKTDFAEMAKKTVLKRSSKLWPLSSELASALEAAWKNEDNASSPMDFAPLDEETTSEGAPIPTVEVIDSSAKLLNKIQAQPKE